MKTVQICLDSIDKVKSFVNEITRFDTEFDLISGRYVIDAKSIMGIFSLDLSKPITLNIHAENNLDEILSIIKPFIVESSEYLVFYIAQEILRFPVLYLFNTISNDYSHTITSLVSIASSIILSMTSSR